MQRYLAFLEKKFRPLSKILKIWYNEVIDNNAFLGYDRWIYATALTSTKFLKGTMHVPKRPFIFLQRNTKFYSCTQTVIRFF